MNYIVFDLEWNQCPYGKERENKKLPFEIIEIGAVKLNKNRERIDEFHEVIKPVIYRRLHFNTRKIVHVTSEEMQNSRVFPEVAEDFLAWCGRDAAFVTWGALDLTELQRNLKYYYMEEMLPGPIYYYDAQKLYAIASGDRKERKSLGTAAEEQKIDVKGDFHMALVDARYTATLFAGLDEQLILANPSIDCFQNPKTKEEEITIVYDKYVKFISREFDTKEALMNDREVSSMCCIDCGRKTVGRIRWFSTNNAKTHMAVGDCKEHGLLKGKIRVKKSTGGKFYCVKTQKHITNTEYEVIKNKKNSIRRHRQEKKQKHRMG